MAINKSIEIAFGDIKHNIIIIYIVLVEFHRVTPCRVGLVVSMSYILIGL